jgi:hypothetical protein
MRSRSKRRSCDNEPDDEWWIAHSDASVTRPIELIGRRARVGIPVLAAEIVLRHKAPRSTAEDDGVAPHFAAPAIAYDERDWFDNALERHQLGQPWVRTLRERQGG